MAGFRGYVGGPIAQGTITADDLCVPPTVEKPFSEDGWIFELKYDGFRLLVTHQI